MKTNIFLTMAAASVIAFSGCRHHAYMGDRNFENKDYAEAANHYEKANQLDEEVNLQLRLAESYRMYNKTVDAEKWYAKAFAQHTNIEPVYKLHYGQVLRANGKDAEAQPYMEQYLAECSHSKKLEEKLLSNEFDIRADEVDHNFTVTKLEMNKENTCAFSPTYYKDGIVFATERNVSNNNKKADWTNRKFLEMAYGEINNDGSIKTVKVFAENTNSPFHEGPAVFNNKENTFYFTRSNFEDGDLKMNNKKEVNLKIYRAEMVDGEWQNVEELPFNSPDYSCAHPAVSNDGSKLYFSSDMPGGIGEADLYVVDLKEDGTISEPRNLGDNINTLADDVFPTINVDEGGVEHLYYSSMGHKGLGGLDIFKVRNVYGEWGQPRLLSAPVNSDKDDFGFIFTGKPDNGYFSSSRGNEEGIDNIFYFTQNLDNYLEILVVNKDTREPIKKAKVVIDDMNTNNDLNMFSDKDGKVFTKIARDDKFNLRANKEKYHGDEHNLSTFDTDYGDTLKVVLELEPLELNKPIVMENIYYDFDKYNIRSDAKRELNELVETLKSNPQVAIRLGSHTDSRGSDIYNERLAQNRAESAVNFLVRNGIDRDRLTAKGFGEYRLLNKCSDEVECSEQKHQLNRRTEFTITSWDYEEGNNLSER